jgi:hypothetical protein
MAVHWPLDWGAILPHSEKRSGYDFIHMPHIVKTEEGIDNCFEDSKAKFQESRTEGMWARKARR